MNKIIYSIVFAALFWVKDARAELLPIESFNLNNGLQVIVVSNTKAPIVKQMLWYKTGSSDEPVGRGGVAHLLEHLMLRGKKKVPDSEFNDIIAQNGGDSNAFTSTDFTAYHEFVDISRLEVVMALEADRMVNLDFDDDAFQKERQIVFQERKQRIDNNPTAQFSEIMNRTLWQDCPYARPVTGTEEEILNLTSDDVKTFYDKHYSPDNAVLILSGDIDASTAKQLAEKHFGGIEKSGTKTSRNPVCSSIKNNKNVYHIKMSHPEIKTPRVVRRYIAPSLKENPEQAYALMVFSKYFGEGDNSFLNQELVLKNKVAAAGSSYDALSRGDGVFSLSAVPSPGKTAAETEDLLQTALNEALKSLNKDKLEKEKHKMTSGLVYIRDNPEDAAMLVGQMAALGFNLNEINDYEKNIKNVTLGDIKEAVSDMLSSSTSITGYLLPAAKEDK